MPVVSVFDSTEVQATILALKVMRKDYKKEVYARTRRLILPEWNESIATRIGGDKFASQMILKNTRVKIGQSLQLEAATKTRPTVSGGLSPDPHFYLAEFGADPKVTEVQGRRGSTRYTYRRTVNTQFKPRTKYGRYGFDAAGEMVKRSIALWVQSTWQLMYEALDRSKD